MIYSDQSQMHMIIKILEGSSYGWKKVDIKFMFNIELIAQVLSMIIMIGTSHISN